MLPRIVDETTLLRFQNEQQNLTDRETASVMQGICDDFFRKFDRTLPRENILLEKNPFQTTRPFPAVLWDVDGIDVVTQRSYNDCSYYNCYDVRCRFGVIPGKLLGVK